MSDERGSGRFYQEMLTSANQYFTKKVSVWDCGFAMKDIPFSRNLQTSFPQPINKQIFISNDLRLQQPGIIFSGWQSMKQNFAAISALLIDYLGTLASVPEFLQKMWAQTPLSYTSDLGLESI
ncbi:hypothetical protein DP117_02435 [Brasilonema sp. UFV-L1]|nr:hypothetical protein [Brasilonema sp. UFV-L1]